MPYLRPYVWLVVIFGLAQLGSLAAAASIPKVIQYIIDGPISHHELTHLFEMAGLLLYCRFAESRTVSRYLTVVVVFALSLMAVWLVAKRRDVERLSGQAQ